MKSNLYTFVFLLTIFIFFAFNVSAQDEMIVYDADEGELLDSVINKNKGQNIKYAKDIYATKKICTPFDQLQGRDYRYATTIYTFNIYPNNNRKNEPVFVVIDHTSFNASIVINGKDVHEYIPISAALCKTDVDDIQPAVVIKYDESRADEYKEYREYTNDKRWTGLDKRFSKKLGFVQHVGDGVSYLYECKYLLERFNIPDGTVF